MRDSPLLEAFSAWSADTDAAGVDAADTDVVGVDAAADTDAAGVDAAADTERLPPGQAEFMARASRGHSPTVRALVNTSDAVTAIARSVARAPSVTLRSRVMTTVAAQQAVSKIPLVSAKVSAEVSAEVSAAAKVSASGKAGATPPAGSPSAHAAWAPPNEATGWLHQADPAELERSRRSGPLLSEREQVDPLLSVLIEQVAPFFDFEVVLVSAVVGDLTIHRVHRGFPPELGSMDSVPRQLSFCTHTVSGAEPLIVEDAAAEAFFRRSVLVTQMGARSSLGIPIVDGDVVLGSLCLISVRPQRIDDLDVMLLSRFAEVARTLVVSGESGLSKLAYPSRPGQSTPGIGESAARGAWLSGAWVYETSWFDALARQQRERARRVERGVRTLMLEGVSADQLLRLGEGTRSLVVGEGGSGLRVLMPSNHPAASELLEGLPADQSRDLSQDAE